MDAFQQDWIKFHSGSWPIGHILRDTPGWNLTRFHLLPGKRAVASDHSELRGLIERYNTMATAVLGDGQPCWLVLLASPNENAAHRKRRMRVERQWKLSPGWSFYSGTDTLTYTVMSGEVIWQHNRFNRLFLHVYQRRLWDVLFMNQATGAVFTPYEAGCEVSQPTPQQLMDVISGYYGWLPKNGDGFLSFNPAQMQGTTFKVSKPCSEAISSAVKKPAV
ncbi:hypothetical protein [Asticcacaulis sp. AC402]|uniref:DUF3885 domain-containing protein n=1 Tax=Asticcacaulis sp. AC402 TaxID=1282361 RepID=UPI0003C3FFE1|nr:hypothetical protein [Asticcacaulis sp. AC402]ESQ74534.1 hypothetical protein ABAC402_13685 [Asticcacaulis sp. AC402]